jgi:hypothetical protein
MAEGEPTFGFAFISYPTFMEFTTFANLSQTL